MKTSKSIWYKTSVRYIVYSLVLTTLYVIASTNLVYNEDEHKLYRLSVITYETDSKYMERFKLGIEQLRDKWMIEINTVTLYEDKPINHQIELIEREVANGAEALILFPAEKESIGAYLATRKWDIPILSIETYLEGYVDVWIHSDERERDGQLAEKIVADKVDTVYLVGNEKQLGSIKERERWLQERIEDTGQKVYVQHYKDRESLEILLKILLDNDNIGIVGLDRMVLEALSNKTHIVAKQDIKIYGMGYENSSLEQLEKGHIEALSFYDEYALGYLSGLCAIALIDGEDVTYEQKIGGGVVTKEQMYEEIYEKLLFPIY